MGSDGALREARAFAARLRYLGYFGEHAALAGALRLAPPPRSSPRGPDGRLRVTFLSAYPPTHVGTVSRFTRWVPHLERAGCDVEILTPSTDAEFAQFESGDPASVGRYYRACIINQWGNLRRAAQADVAVLHRGVFPFSPWQRPTFERQLARLNGRLVYDFYDAIWLQRQQASDVARSGLGRWLHPPDKIEQIIQLARVVTVSNESLASFAAQHQADDVRVVPMLVDTSSYEPRRHGVRERVVIGWMGNRHQIPRLLALAPALRSLGATRDIVVRVVAPIEVEIPGVPVESLTHPWSAESERDDLQALDIGLLPLEESEHDRGKSPLKLLQYAAAGLAIVATPVAMDMAVFRPGENFLPASNEQEWHQSIDRLVDDPSLRSRLGAAARAAVADHYSFESYTETFMDALLTAAGKPRSTSAR
jgi:glycosyltransferase involved in cell wall biosynthesis